MQLIIVYFRRVRRYVSVSTIICYLSTHFRVIQDTLLGHQLRHYNGVIVDNNCQIISETDGYGFDGPAQMCLPSTLKEEYSDGAPVICSGNV